MLGTVGSVQQEMIEPQVNSNVAMEGGDLKKMYHS